MRPRRVEASLGILALCVLGSLALHIRAYRGLATLQDARPTTRSGTPDAVDIAFELEGLPEETPPVPVQPQAPDAPRARQAEALKQEAPPPARTVPPEPKAERLAVRQKSENPEVEAPEDARFIAEENRRVAEESVAEERALDGEANTTRAPDRPAAEERAMLSPAEAASEGSDTPGEAASEGGSTAADARVQSSQRRAGGRSLPREGQGSLDPRLRLGWGGFVASQGRDTLAAARRDARAAARAGRRASALGSDRARRWRAFRAAAENYVPGVRSGNQTALNAAAEPFAAYLSRIHVRIHKAFAERFLASLPVGSGELSDLGLRTTLEIVIDQRGRLARLGVVRSSGKSLFDYGAYEAVRKAAPFPPPPGPTLSPDGYAYVHWGFYRNERACGTFNAQGFKLNKQGRRVRDRG